MNKKILTLLAIFIVAISIAGVYAGEELSSHDFGNFKMDIPESQVNISETHGGSGNQTIYAIPNSDLTVFAYVEYWNTSNTNGNNNVTSVILSKLKENYTMENEGNISSWVSNENSREYVYVVPSDDDTQVVLIFGTDTRLPQAIDSVKFN